MGSNPVNPQFSVEDAPSQPQFSIGDAPSSSTSEQSSTGENIAQGFGAGAADTLTGLGKIGSHIPGMSYIAEKVGDVLGLPSLHGQAAADPYTTVQHGIKAAQEGATGNTAGKLGYAGENLTEFLMGDEALKGLAYSEKLMQAAKVAKIIEKSPRLAEAIKGGANILKVQSYLGPEEIEFLNKSPVLKRLATVGMDALRQGLVQGAETTAKTGGDVGEGVKQGAGMAVASAAIGGPLAVGGGLLEKAGKAAKTVGALTDVAKTAPSQPELTDAAQQAIETAKQEMHSTYDTGVKDIAGRLKGAEEPLQGSPLQKKAQELLKTTPDNPEGLTKELRESVKGVVPGTDRAKKMLEGLAGASEDEGSSESFLDKEYGGEAKELPKPPENMSIDNLIKYRETLGKVARDLPYDDKPTLKAVYGLLDGVDDTIEKMAKGADDPEVAQDYKTLRQGYKDKVKFFQPSDKPADQLAYNTVKALRSGTKDEVGQYLFSGNNVRAKVSSVQELLGDEGTKQLGRDIFKSMVEDSGKTSKGGEAGNANPANLISKWNKIPEEARDTMFDSKLGDTAIKQLMQDTKGAASIQHLVRATTAGAAGAGVGSLMHSGVGTLLGLVIGEGGGGFAKGRELLDHIATHPNTWKALGLAAKASSKVGPVGKAIGPAVKGAAAQSLMGKPSIANVYSGAGSALGGSQ